MKKLHVSLAVANLEQSRAFYSSLFGSEPTLERDSYVQWVLDDPAINFVIENGNAQTGLTHLGVQAADADELADQYAKVHSTGAKVIDQGDTQCCYARSTKNWVVDPDGIPWETFLTHERTEDFGTPFVADLQDAVEPEPVAESSSHTCC